jgi:precorrin-6B methylase 2
MLSPAAVVSLSLLLLVGLAVGGFSAAPWLPTKRRDRRALLGRLRVEPGSVVYDLGCGDGAVLFDLAAREPGATYIGYEIAALPWLLGQLRRLFGPAANRRVRLRLRDFYGQPLDAADLVFIFLLDTSYPHVIKKLRAAHLHPNARIVVEAWPLPALTPAEVIRDPGCLPLYVYLGRQFS